MHKICGFYIIYFSIELKIGSSKTRCFFQSLTAAFNCYNLQYLLAIILSLYNVGAFFSLTMTRKPTHLTHINAIINRHDVLHPFEKTFATVHWVRLDLACHSFSTKVKGFLLQGVHGSTGYTWVYRVYKVYMGVQGTQGIHGCTGYTKYTWVYRVFSPLGLNGSLLQENPHFTLLRLDIGSTA